MLFNILQSLLVIVLCLGSLALIYVYAYLFNKYNESIYLPDFR